jgi:integrase
MAKATRNSKLETRTARNKLKASHEPYWAAIGRGLYLGYRKGNQGGAWIARLYIDGKYKKQKLGKADDYQDANSIDVFDYFQAQAQAREFADAQAQINSGISLEPLTVSEVVNNYLEWFKTHRKSYAYTQHTMKKEILPALGDYKVNELTTAKIRQWHEDLAKATSKKTSKEKIEPHEAARRRKATANRILTMLKAALNHAWRDGLVANDEAWRKIKPFRNVDAPKIRYLDVTECQRLINACDPDFRPLVRAALLTGCRYGELVRLKVNDFNSGNGTLYINETKNGKPRSIPLTGEGVTFFNQNTAGKLGNDSIFVRDDGEAWGVSHQCRRLRDACKIAKIEPTISFHVLRHTYGSLLSSKGVPLQVIAELLGHSDTRVTSRHYAHLMPSFVSDTLRANLPNFVEDEKANIKNIAVA